MKTKKTKSELSRELFALRCALETKKISEEEKKDYEKQIANVRHEIAQKVIIEQEIQQNEGGKKI